VVLNGKPRVNAATSTLTAELAEGTYSALGWWNAKVHGRVAGDTTFEIAVELVRRVRSE
jgi:hypothetical protein